MDGPITIAATEHPPGLGRDDESSQPNLGCEKRIATNLPNIYFSRHGGSPIRHNPIVVPWLNTNHVDQMPATQFVAPQFVAPQFVEEPGREEARPR